MPAAARASTDPELLSQVYGAEEEECELCELDEPESSPALKAESPASSTEVTLSPAIWPAPYQAGPDDCKLGKCWYDRQFLIDEGRQLLQELDSLGEKEYEQWEREFDRRASFFDDVAWRGMCLPGFGEPMPGPVDEFAVLRRCLHWQRQQDTVREFQKRQKRAELEHKKMEAAKWWLDKAQAWPHCRRLEQGLCGLNKTSGAGKGAGGGLP